LAGLRSAAGHDFEVIVVDDGTDATLSESQRAAAAPPAWVAGHGAAKARRFHGLRFVGGDLVAFWFGSVIALGTCPAGMSCRSPGPT
jgi:hypothetical protein